MEPPRRSPEACQRPPEALSWGHLGSRPRRSSDRPRRARSRLRFEGSEPVTRATVTQLAKVSACQGLQAPGAARRQRLYYPGLGYSLFSKRIMDWEPHSQ